MAKEGSPTSKAREDIFCFTCCNIFNDWETKSSAVKHVRGRCTDIDWYKDSRDWFFSASEGCILCLRLLDNLDREFLDELRRRIDLGILIIPKMELRQYKENLEEAVSVEATSKASSDSNYQEPLPQDGEVSRQEIILGVDAALTSRNRVQRGFTSSNCGSSGSNCWIEGRSESDSYTSSELSNDAWIISPPDSDDDHVDEGFIEDYNFLFECSFWELKEDSQRSRVALADKGVRERDSRSLTEPSSDDAPATDIVETNKIEEFVPELTISTGSEQSLGLAKEMVESCLSSHLLCKTNWDHNSPTRLIEICHGEKIKLYAPKKSQGRLPYATLSHCWGENKLFKLMVNNKDDLFRSIPLSKLCKTFRDALAVTKALGLRYLWIDSLCIIQDSINGEDWLQEGSRMSDVYSNAVVNIAASNARDGNDGIFFDRNFHRASRHEFNIKSKAYALVEKRLYDRCLANTYLTDRGWCFQERFLARRTLHFTAEQIFCECQCRVACEAWPEGFPYALTQDHTRRLLPSERDRADTWFDTVSLYSNTKLTKQSDKLIAISGVARHFQKETADQYIAGLWRSGLERQLCWSVENEKNGPNKLQNASAIFSLPYKPPSAEKSYRAPSWSWASLDVQITWADSLQAINPKNRERRILSSIQKVNIKLTGKDPLGQLDYASLTLKCGPVFTLQFFKSLSSEDNRHTDVDPRQQQQPQQAQEGRNIRLDDEQPGYPKFGEHKDAGKPSTKPYFWSDSETDYSSDDSNDDLSVYSDDSDFFDFPRDTDVEIYYDLTYREISTKASLFFIPLQSVDLYLTGLIITPAQDKKHGYFRRLGLFVIDIEHSSYRKLIKYASRQPENLMDKDLFQKVLPSENRIPKYRLTLI